MADSYKTKISDQQSSSRPISPDDKQLKQQNPLGDRSVDTSGKSLQENKFSFKDKGSTSIVLTSGQQSLLGDTYKNSNNLVTNNEDIFSEKAAQVYSLDSIANSIEGIEKRGIPYSQLVSLTAEHMLAAANGDASSYGTLQEISENAKQGAAQFVYGIIKKVAENNSSSKANANGFGDSKNEKSTYEQQISQVTKSPLVGGGISSAYSSLNEFNPDSSILDVADATIDKLEQIQTDYEKQANKKSLTTSPHSTTYSSAPRINFSFEKSLMSEWETMTYPDAMSNMYDVYFRVRNDVGKDERFLSKGPAIIKALFNGPLLSARVNSIEIPAYQRQTTTVNFMSGSVDRPVNGYDTPGRSSFTLRGDTRLYYVSSFNSVAGTSLDDMFEVGSTATENTIYSIVSDINDSYFKQIEDWKQDFNNIKNLMQTEIAEAREEEYRNALVNYQSSIVEKDDFTKWYNKKAEDWAKEHNSDMSGFNESIYINLKDELDKTISDLHKKRNEEASQAAKETSSILAAIREKRKVKSKYEKEINSLQAKRQQLGATLTGKISNVQNKILQAFSSKLKSLEEEKEVLKDKRAAKLSSLQAQTDSKSINYVTEILSKNSLIVAQPLVLFDKEDFDNVALMKFIKEAPRLDIIVKRTWPSNRFRTRLSEKKDERFVFEDVKILGTSDAIKFSRESAEPQEFTYDFIYKRFYKEDMYDTTGAWVESQTKQFVNYIVNAASGELEKMLQHVAWNS